MWAGVVAGGVEAVVTMPMEVVKTRQQIGGRHGGLGIAASVQDILRSPNGVRGLYSGLTVQMAQSSGKVGIRFLVYGEVAKWAGQDKTMKAVGGFLAGAAESLLWITPCERIKIVRIRDGHQPFSHLVRTIWSEGPRALWIGASPTVVRNSFTVGFRFYIYDKILDRFCVNNAALAGFAVGAISSVLNNPIDVIKSEMQAATAAKRYSSMSVCAKDILKTKGVSHLFTAGATARILKIGIGQSVIFQVVSWLS